MELSGLQFHDRSSRERGGVAVAVAYPATSGTRLSQEAEDDIPAASDWIEEQKFDKLHKIIIRLPLSSLEEAISENPDSVEVPDAMGRTPRLWAAAGGDHQAVQILLDHNADPKVMDM